MCVQEKDPWAEVCEDLAQIEKRRAQLIAHVEQLRRTQAILLEQPTGPSTQAGPGAGAGAEGNMGRGDGGVCEEARWTLGRDRGAYE